MTFAPLDTFTASGIVTDILSPEYNMQSRIEMHFATDIFTDTGALYSAEYMRHRSTEKIKFLKHLSITPNINITEDDIELSPNRAVIYPKFIEEKQYRLDLDTIQDIYGRETSMRMDITAKTVPSLSLRI